ncbi:unnamed protein product [Acanthosepion pharaonis]|uniref:Uncharacterized protein n=1 Tax=Acanthosepion pharaonis TaxID=158019 RepID=A0A812DLX9_ACAPH|nr:unnamed protein product [Sepia pharaonis]
MNWAARDCGHRQGNRTSSWRALLDPSIRISASHRFPAGTPGTRLRSAGAGQPREATSSRATRLDRTQSGCRRADLAVALATHFMLQKLLIEGGKERTIDHHLRYLRRYPRTVTTTLIAVAAAASVPSSSTRRKVACATSSIAKRAPRAIPTGPRAGGRRRRHTRCDERCLPRSHRTRLQSGQNDRTARSCSADRSKRSFAALLAGEEIDTLQLALPAAQGRRVTRQEDFPSRSCHRRDKAARSPALPGLAIVEPANPLHHRDRDARACRRVKDRVSVSSNGTCHFALK